MKMKRILPLLMAGIMVTASVPMTAGATEAGSQTSESTEETGDSQSESKEIDGSQLLNEDSSSGSTAGSDTWDDAEDTDEYEDQEIEDTEEDTDEESEDVLDNQVESDNVVTLGENLSEAQREAMYQYFGTSADEVRTIIVTHEDEVQYMEGIATYEQIGATTNSCAYVEPTESGGIKVKTANLTYVTSAMIASTLTTAGMENCNVIAACPFEASGTGALTGIIMAYETASGEELDEGMKEAAMEELITTGNLAETIGSEEATAIIGEVKAEIIDKGLTDAEEIGEVIEEIAEEHGVTITEEQRQKVISLMQQIAQYDYDLDAIQKTLDNLSGEVSALKNVWNTVKSFFVGSDDGILSGTDESALGTDVLTDSTGSTGGFQDGLLTRILNLFSK